MKGKHAGENKKKEEILKNSAKKSKNPKKKWVINIILIILVVIFCYSSYQVIIWLKSDQQIKKLENGLFTEVVSEVGEEQKRTTIDFDKLQSVNTDIIAWIKIDDTHINYPIMQGESDEYYLRKDVNKEYSISGSIFVDSTTNPDFSDDNTIIYGHNMKNGRMFSDLAKIYNGELGKSVILQIYTKNKFYQYKVIASYVEEPNLPLLRKNFTQTEKTDYIKTAIKKSKIKFDAESQVDTTKNILTLITCDVINTRRIVVHGIQYDD